MTHNFRLAIMSVLIVGALFGIGYVANRSVNQMAAEPVVEEKEIDCAGQSREACFNKQFDVYTSGDSETSSAREEVVEQN